jgi:hypothetical protein
MTQQIAVREEMGLSKAGLDHTRDQLLLLENFVKEVLRKDEDYGVIPGTHGKPSLLKPGAANVTAAFNCHAEPLIDTFTLDPQEGFVSYEAHVDLVSNQSGMVMARGFGNCNSHEVKYRYRWEGRDENRVRIENTEPLDQANTIKKMAIKRAEVDAAMRLPGVARFFTQDLEDMQTERITTSTPPDNRYQCPIHKTEWFKRGSMKGYAHPIEGKGTWCNMKDAPLDAPEHAQDVAQAPQGEAPAPSAATTAPVAPQVPDAIPISVGELLTRATMPVAKGGLGFKSRTEVFAKLGIQSAIEIASLEDAWAKLKE